MKNMHFRFAALIACGISLSAQAAVTATVNSNVVASGENIQLRIQRDGSADGQPDISPLKKDFDVLGSSSGSNVQIINGHMSTQTQITVLLAPKHDGKIQIPPLQWGGEQSAAIELTVGGSAGAAQGNSQPANDSSHVYLTTTLDQKQPYVQAAVVLTVRLYTDQPLIQASLDLPASSDVLVKPLGKDTQLSETRNGRNYQIIERKYLLFPQRSGKLSLNGPVLDAQVQDNSNSGNDAFDSIFRQMPFGGMVGSTRPLRVHAKPVELNVLPRPASAGGANWLPAQKVTLEELGETWRQDKATVHVGEPLTRHLHLDALGLTGAQLPDPNTFMPVPEGIKAYPDQATAADKPQGNTVLGSREQNIALIASRPGHYELPAVRLNWWDTLHNEKREITLPAHILDVLPAAAGTTAVTMPPANAEPSISPNQGAHASPIGTANPLEQSSRIAESQPWMWLSFALGLLWLGTTAAWWRARRHVQPAPPAKIAAEKMPLNSQGSSAFKGFKRACSDNDPHAARRHLLAWAGTVWPADTPLGLNELSRRLGDAKADGALRQLDRACYTGSVWHGAELARSMSAPPGKAAAKENKHTLPELYR
jgi:hypothetical protein